MKEFTWKQWVVEVASLLRESTHRIIVAHKNADPDALGAAVLMGALMRVYGGGHCYVFPEGLSRLSKRTLAEAGIVLPQCTSRAPPDLLVIVDSSNPSQLGDAAELLEESRRVIVVDHHEPGALLEKADLAIYDSGAASASELVAMLLRETGVSASSAEASIGLTGIYYDTKKFSIIGRYSFEASAFLYALGGRPLAITAREEPDFSERMARLKAASRALIARVCREIIIAVTHVGSHESSAARALIEIGADIAVVATHRPEGTRVSLRASRRAAEHGIRVDVIARYIAQKYGGEGGGHQQVAMVQLAEPRDPAELASELARSLPGKIARLCVESRGKRRGQ